MGSDADINAVRRLDTEATSVCWRVFEAIPARGAVVPIGLEKNFISFASNAIVVSQMRFFRTNPYFRLLSESLLSPCLDLMEINVFNSVAIVTDFQDFVVLP